MFTYRYSQPEEYHFSLDSIHLAEFLAQHLQTRKDLSTLRVLDLCAGCGVIGIELSWYLRELTRLDFIEIQDVYTPHFQQNVATVNRPELQLNWHLLNYDCLLEEIWKNSFDLIVSNPPYFRPEQGILSPSEFKNRCRFFLDSTFHNFIRALENGLAPNGEAYFLLRPLQHHGCDLLSDIKEIVKDTNCTAEVITHIRGNIVILLKKTR